jgi:cell division transport system permease protein
MSRLVFFITEGLRALRRNAAPSIAAIVTVILTVVLLGVLIPVFYATQNTTNEVRNRLLISVFLRTDSSQTQITETESQLKALPHVNTVEYISPQEAIPIVSERLGSDNSDVLKALPQHRNPFPPAFHVNVDDPDNLALVASEITPPGADGHPRAITPAINEVNYGKEDTQKILSLTTAVTVLLLSIGALLLVASLLLVGNTIRLSIYARRREVEVMKLVGATNWFIRWPFVAEGLIVGFIGSGLAIGLLAIGKFVIIDPLAHSFDLVDGLTTISFVPLLVVLVCAAMAVSAIGSGLTLRRFLKV